MLVMISIHLFQLHNQASTLNVNSQEAGRFNRESNMVLTLLFIKLHWAREEDVLSLMRRSLWCSQELIRIEIKRQSICSSWLLLLFRLGLVNLYTLHATTLKSCSACTRGPRSITERDGWYGILWLKPLMNNDIVGSGHNIDKQVCCCLFPVETYERGRCLRCYQLYFLLFLLG